MKRSRRGVGARKKRKTGEESHLDVQQEREVEELKPDPGDVSDDGDDHDANGISEYELQRLKNMRENEEVLRQLQIDAPFMAAEVSEVARVKREQRRSARGLKIQQTAPKEEGPSRRSLRLQGVDVSVPFRSGSSSSVSGIPAPIPKSKAARREGPVSLVDEDMHGDHSSERACRAIWNTLRTCAEEGVEEEKQGRVEGRAITSFFPVQVSEDCLFRLAPKRIYSMAVAPICRAVVAVGDGGGRIGILDVDRALGTGAVPSRATDDIPGGIGEAIHDDIQANGGVGEGETHEGSTERDEDEDTSFAVFSPHSRTVGAVAFAPRNAGMLYSASYDQQIRCVDVEHGAFDLVFENDTDARAGQVSLGIERNGVSLFSGDSFGLVFHLDRREGRKGRPMQMHSRKVYGTELHPTNDHLLLTCSLDQTIALWDLRMVRKKSPKPLSTVESTLGVTSCLFAPQYGKVAAATCNDDTIRLINIADNISMSVGARIKHDTHTGRWVTNLRATFDPRNDSTLIVGNKRRCVDLYTLSGNDAGVSTALKKRSISGEVVTAIPCLNVAHPTRDLLITANSGGKVLVWR